VNIEQDMRRVCAEATRLGFHPAEVVHMHNQQGAIGAARRPMASPDFCERDLAKFFELGRLDLTVEAVVLRNPQHFHEGEVVTALRRLERFGYSIERFACRGLPRR
jgi:hypothetical protein